jgi:hypothetical protein
MPKYKPGDIVQITSPKDHKNYLQLFPILILDICDDRLNDLVQYQILWMGSTKTDLFTCEVFDEHTEFMV